MRTLTLLILLLIVPLLHGCASSRGERTAWTENATLLPGWQRIGRSAADAAFDPQVWIPLLGAATFTLGDLDEEVSDWARDKTPLFGDTEDATDASDDLLFLGTAFYVGTALAADSGDNTSEWLLNKGRGLLGGFTILAVNNATTSGLKSLAGRERPGGGGEDGDDDSFPSRHTSHAATSAALASRNLDYTGIGDTGKAWLRVGLHGTAALTGWARIEAGRHYPSDVLAGYALGQFLGRFLNDAFLMPDRGMHLTLHPADEEGRLMLGLQFRP